MGPERCGECHAVQYQKWKRSRHAQTIRFPGEHPEVDNDLKKKLYGSDASILPDGITPDVIYATIGTPRTKYGYVDGWLVRGSTTSVTVSSATVRVRSSPAATSSPAAGLPGSPRNAALKSPR